MSEALCLTGCIARSYRFEEKGWARLLGAETETAREVTIPNDEGLHARPVMLFVDLASKYKSKVSVRNLTRQGEEVDGKSAMQMMLLEATKGCVLKITARGEDALETLDSLVALVETGFKQDSRQPLD